MTAPIPEQPLDFNGVLASVDRVYRVSRDRDAAYMAAIADRDRTIATRDATVSALMLTRDDLALRLQQALDRIAELEQGQEQSPPAPVGQFPGDPGPEKIIVGIDVTRGQIEKVRAREQAIGMKLANRTFNNAGIGDFAVPNGPIATKIKRDIAEGRMPVPSGKPGIENLAAHKFEAELVAFFKWYQSALAAAGMYGAIIFHHEPSNDWKADNNNLPAMAKHKADYAEAQRWIRACMNKAFKRSESRILFAGAFMTYEWSAQGVKQWGSADLFDPGKDPANPDKHVFDLLCGDHYNPALDATTLERPQLTAFLASGKKWGVPVGLTELGVKTANPDQAGVLKRFLARAKELGFRLIVLWDSEAGEGGQVSTDPSTYWTMKAETLAVYKEFCLSQGANPNATKGA